MSRTCNFDKKANSLPRFAVEIWNGFVFINFDTNAAPLAPRLAQVAKAVEGYDLANITGPRPEPAPTMAWNWKVMFENNNDGYHASKLHHGPLHDFIPSNLAEFPNPTPPMPVSCATTARCTPMPPSTRRSGLSSPSFPGWMTRCATA
jgi:phenylpropionate dioxygenase-like ring-hydroxylating dioxygenase large terminal subunit